jgi:hypothetical protein
MSYGNDNRNVGEEAGRSFLGGFSGCLGVGLAIAVVIALAVGGCAALVSHGSNSNNSASSAPPPAPAFSSAPAFTAGPASAPSPPVSITQSGSCTLTSDPDPANAYYFVSTVLTVQAPGQVTINSMDVEVIGPDGTQLGSLSDAAPESAASTTVSWPLVVSSGTVPLRAVANPGSLSGQFGSTCKVTSVAYDNGNTAP